MMDEVADKIIKSHSFEFKTFDEAKATIYVGGKKYVYDRLSLHCYESELSPEEYWDLGMELREKAKSVFNNAQEKMRREYIELLSFLKVYSELWNYRIEKAERPDFILEGERRVGVEITRLITEVDCILERICEENLGKGKSAEQIYRDAIKHHKDRAKQYDYKDYGGIAGISAPLEDINESQFRYAEEIVNKFKKYCNVFDEYDEFIILCDAMYNIGVTSLRDAQTIITKVEEQYSEAKGCTVVILYNEYDRENKVSAARFNM